MGSLFDGIGGFPLAAVRHGIRPVYEKTAREIKAMDDWNPFNLILGRRYHNEIYSKFTSENFANEYAMVHFADVLEKVRSSIGYTEQNLLEMSMYE